MKDSSFGSTPISCGFTWELIHAILSLTEFMRQLSRSLDFTRAFDEQVVAVVFPESVGLHCTKPSNRFSQICVFLCASGMKDFRQMRKVFRCFCWCVVKKGTALKACSLAFCRCLTHSSTGIMVSSPSIASL